MKSRRPYLIAIRHPLRFAWRSAKAFKANQGLLLAGAVAYYALLSVVPLLILTVLALSRFIEEGELLSTVGRYLEWLLPGQSGALVLFMPDLHGHFWGKTVEQDFRQVMKEGGQNHFFRMVVYAPD